MKLTVAILLACVALAQAANLIANIIDNSTHVIELWDGGAYFGTLVETAEGGVDVLDIHGNTVDFHAKPNLAQDPEQPDAPDAPETDQLDTADARVTETLVERKGVPLAVALKWARIIAKWGRKVWQFIFCISVDSAWKCHKQFENCAGRGLPPWYCAPGLVCAGKKAAHCKLP